VSGARASSLLVRITAAPRRLIAIVRSAIKQELHAKLAADGRTATARRRRGGGDGGGGRVRREERRSADNSKLHRSISST